MKPWLSPYVVKLRGYGKVLGDVAFDVTSGDMLFSKRLLDPWRSAGLHGLDDVEEVDVISTKPTRMAGIGSPFFHIRAPRTGARIDDAKSHIVRQTPPTCDLCGGAAIVDAILNLHIDEASWSGEDIFAPWGVYGVVIVTERVVSLASGHELRNVTTTPCESFRWDPLAKRSS
jgi:hypothetical protein